MSQLEVKKNSSTVLEIEIRPDRNGRWFWLLWAVSGVFILAVGWYQLGSITFRSLPIWIILLIFSAIVLIKGWQAWVWGSRGLEKLRVDSNELSYEREGSVLDRKAIQIRLGDISGLEVLSFGLGDSWEPNRLQVKAKRRSLYLGRNLSKTQGRELSELLGAALSRHAKPAGL